MGNTHQSLVCGPKEKSHGYGWAEYSFPAILLHFFALPACDDRGAERLKIQRQRQLQRLTLGCFLGLTISDLFFLVRIWGGAVKPSRKKCCSIDIFSFSRDCRLIVNLKFCNNT